MRRTKAVLTSCVLGAILALAVPGGAPAAGPALDQYIETVPGAGSDKPSQSSGGGGRSTVSGSQLEALQASGDDGVAAAAVVAATAPRVRERGKDNGKGKASAGKDDPAFVLTEEGNAPIPAVLSTVAGGGSGGVALPVVLVAVLVAGLALVALRRRASTGRR